MKSLRPGVCSETKLRIDVAVAAYAYEFENDPVVSDSAFDAMCAAVRPDVSTGSPVHDEFFRNVFRPHTGQWVHQHPDIQGLRRIYKLKTERADLFKPPMRPKPEVKHPCPRCNRDMTVNPLYGGCHC